MSSIIKVIGTLVFSIVMYSVPILFTCSILLHWHPFLKMLCVICAVLQLIALCFAVQAKAEDDGT